MKKIWNLVARDLWIVLLDIIAVNAAYYLALLIRFFDFQGTVAAFRTSWFKTQPNYARNYPKNRVKQAIEPE